MQELLDHLRHESVLAEAIHPSLVPFADHELADFLMSPRPPVLENAAHCLPLLKGRIDQWTAALLDVETADVDDEPLIRQTHTILIIRRDLDRVGRDESVPNRAPEWNLEPAKGLARLLNFLGINARLLNAESSTTAREPLARKFLNNYILWQPSTGPGGNRLEGVIHLPISLVAALTDDQGWSLQFRGGTVAIWRSNWRVPASQLAGFFIAAFELGQRSTAPLGSNDIGFTECQEEVLAQRGLRTLISLGCGLIVLGVLCLATLISVCSP